MGAIEIAAIQSVNVRFINEPAAFWFASSSGVKAILNARGSLSKAGSIRFPP